MIAMSPFSNKSKKKDHKQSFRKLIMQVKRVLVELKTSRTYHNTNPALQEHLAFEIFASPLLLTTSIVNE